MKLVWLQTVMRHPKNLEYKMWWYSAMDSQPLNISEQHPLPLCINCKIIIAHISIFNIAVCRAELAHIIGVVMPQTQCLREEIKIAFDAIDYCSQSVCKIGACNFLL